MNKKRTIFQEDEVRIRQLQRMIGDGTSLSGSIFTIVLISSVFSIVTNSIVGYELGILPAALGVLFAQSVMVTVFLKTDVFDRVLARALVLLYVAYYAFIVVAIEPDYNILFTALLGFPQFTVLVMGSREGTFWSVITSSLIGGGALLHGMGEGFETVALSQIIFVLFQTGLVIMFVYVIDVVARQYAIQLLSEERSSRESEARYEVLLDSVTDGLVAVDRQGVVQFVNKAALGLTGMDAKELQGSVAASTLLLADSKEAIVRSADYPLNRVLSTLETVEVDQFSRQKLFMVKKNGERFLVGMTISPVQVGTENIGALMLFRDLTEINATERAKSEFVSLASHQLRTPLNVVSWYSEKLLKKKKGDLNEKQTDYVKEIHDNNKRMIELVSDLLNVSRVDLGRIKLKHEPVQLFSLAEALIKEIKPLAEKKQIVFTHELPHTDITFKDSDKNVMTVIMQNLLSNAIKYTPEHGRVEFSVKRVKRNLLLNEAQNIRATSDGVIITARDNGLGIPTAQQHRIFTKLFRADNAQTLDVEGTGLGLYVTRSFVNELNGEIWFESKEGEGTTFFVYIPE